MANKKMTFRPSIQFGGGHTEDGLGTMARNDPAGFMKRSMDLIDKGELTFSDITSLRHLFDSLFDVQVPVLVDDALGNKRAIMASAFPLLSGGLVANEVQQGFDAVPTIGGELVSEVEDNKRFSTFASVLSIAQNHAQVKEFEPFPEMSAGEEKYTIAHLRNGAKISITGEAIEENDWAGIMDRSNGLGDWAGEVIEEQTLRRACDIDGSGSSPAEPYVLHINGAAASLYTTSNSTLTRLPSTGNRLTNNALTDASDLERARKQLAAMTNSRGKRINIPMSRCILLVPDALVSAARTLLGSDMTPGVENEVNDWGPRGAYRPRLLSSPKLDDLSTTVWYLGDFKKQLKRKWKMRFEYASISGNTTQLWLDRRVAAQFRIAWDMEVGAVGYQHVIQNLAGTTAP